MAADDELPRGLTLTSIVTGNTAFVTFPAIAGITWVLTHLEGFAGSNAGPVAGTFTVAAISSQPKTLAEGGVSNDVANTVQGYTWDGQVPTEQGDSITAGFNSGSATWTETVVATAYPM